MIRSFVSLLGPKAVSAVPGQPACASGFHPARDPSTPRTPNPPQRLGVEPVRPDSEWRRRHRAPAAAAPAPASASRSRWRRCPRLSQWRPSCPGQRCPSQCSVRVVRVGGVQVGAASLSPDKPQLLPSCVYSQYIVRIHNILCVFTINYTYSQYFVCIRNIYSVYS